MQTEYLYIDAASIDHNKMEKAVAIIKAGGLAAFPTETVYGLGASAFNREGVLRLFEVKQRPRSQPFLLHISRLDQLEGIVDLNEDALELATRFWPGPLSIIVPGARGVVSEMLDHKGSIGLRYPSHPVSIAFIDITGPLAATSANLHGSKSPGEYRQVRSELDGLIEVVLAVETGITGLDSTIIDMSTNPYQIVRSGELDWAALEKLLPGKIVRKG